MREKDEAMDGAALDRQCCFVAAPGVTARLPLCCLVDPKRKLRPHRLRRLDTPDFGTAAISSDGS
jgi:hypothetical protein